MRARLSGALAATLVAAMVGTACAGRIAPAAPVATPAGVRFVLMQPGARSVALAGSFNQWSATSYPLVRDGSRGLWAVVVPLPPG